MQKTEPEPYSTHLSKVDPSGLHIYNVFSQEKERKSRIYQEKKQSEKKDHDTLIRREKKLEKIGKIYKEKRALFEEIHAAFLYLGDICKRSKDPVQPLKNQILGCHKKMRVLHDELIILGLKEELIFNRILGKEISDLKMRIAAIQNMIEDELEPIS